MTTPAFPRRISLAFSPTWTGSFSGVFLFTIIHFVAIIPIMPCYHRRSPNGFLCIDLSEMFPGDHLRPSDSPNTLGYLLRIYCLRMIADILFLICLLSGVNESS